jgi:hypothetical protein
MKMGPRREGRASARQLASLPSARRIGATIPASIPPSTGSSAPVISREASDVKNAMASAMSSGTGSFRIGTAPLRAAYAISRPPYFDTEAV